MGKEFLAVGRIKRAVGLKGEVLIRAYSQLDSITSPGCFFLKAKNSSYKKFQITAFRQKGPREIVCHLKGIKDRTNAESIEKQEIFQKIELLPNTDIDEYYWYQLKGLEVIDKEMGNLGKIEAILETGANDVFVVRNNQGEILVPMVEDVIRKVDIKAGKCMVNLPPGLFEATFIKKAKNR